MNENIPDAKTDAATIRSITVESPAQRPPDPASVSPPEIPDYQLIKRIGQGSYGEVWLARNVMGTCRAVKIVYRHSFQSDRPFEREFDGIKKFEPVSQTNESQLKIFHVGRRNGYFYYVMELADDAETVSGRVGQWVSETDAASPSQLPAHSLTHSQNLDPETYTAKTLRSEIQRRKRLPVEESLDLSIKLTQALSHLHRHGLVHRDIKPSNIIFVNGVPKLADIGLVADTEGTLSFVGTEGYIPPEGPGKPAADIFSLGKVLYEISTGHDRNQFPELPTLWDSASERESFAELNEVIIKSCAADAAQRYETAQQMHEDLLLVRTGKSLRRLRVMERRFREMTRAAAVLTILGLLVTVGLFYQRRQTALVTNLAHRESNERQRAEGAVKQLEIERACEMLDKGDASLGLIHLARALRDNATNRFVAERLMAAINQRNFLLPVVGPLRHADRVTGARFSPDGRRIVSMSRDQTARIWDAATGQALTEPLRHEGWVTTAQFSPDGRQVVTGSKDHTARVWDAQTGEQVLAELNHDAEVRSVEFSPDGKRVLTVCSATVRIWSAETGRLLIESIQHQAEVKTAHFSPDGKRVLTASTDKTARIWDSETGQALARPMQHGTTIVYSGVTSAEFSPDGQRVVTAGEDRTARIWDARTGEPMTEPIEHRLEVRYGKFSPDGKRFISGDRGATLRDATTGKDLAEFLVHACHFDDAEFSPDGRFILTRKVPLVESSGLVVLWDAFTGARVSEVSSHRPFFDARFDSSGQRIVTCSLDGVWIWDVRPGYALPVALRHDRWVGFAQFSPDGRILATATDDQISTMQTRDRETAMEDSARSAWLWDAGTGRVLAGPLRHGGGVVSVQFSPDGRRVVTASRDHTARIWDTHTGQPLTEPLDHPEQVRFAKFTPDGKQVVTSCWWHRAWLWDASTGKLVREFLDHAIFVASNPHMPLRTEDLSPDGKWLVTGSRDYAQIWNVQTGEPLGNRLEGNTRVARFSPDAKFLVTGGQGFEGGPIRGAARVWDAQTLELISKSPKHDFGLTSAEFSPDSRKLITASVDATARIWDVRTDQPLTKQLQHKGEVLHAEFSPDSKRVVTASYWDRAGLLWDVDSGLPLSQPLQHDDLVNYASFSPDGRWVVTAGNDRKAKVWEVPQAPLPIPDWLPELAEALVGKRLNAQGLPEPVPIEHLLALKQRFAASTATDDYTCWAKWLFADRSQRTISAFSTVTIPEYVAHLLEENTLVSLEEAVRLSPTNGFAYARLAQQIVKRPGTRNVGPPGDAAFYSSLAVQFAPENPEVRRMASEIRR